MDIIVTFIPLFALAAVCALIFFVIIKIAKPYNKIYKVALGLGLFGGFLILWFEGGVGINGPPHEITEWIELGVFGIGIIGALIGRFQPKGMTLALFASAAAQASAIFIAIGFGLHSLSGSSITEIVFLNGFFTCIFICSALLFRKAGLKQPENGTTIPA